MLIFSRTNRSLPRVRSRARTLARRFFTYNYLQERIPKQDEGIKKLARNGLIGFCSSVVSDTCSNSIRVVKVYKQVRCPTGAGAHTVCRGLDVPVVLPVRVMLGDVRFCAPLAGSWKEQQRSSGWALFGSAAVAFLSRQWFCSYSCNGGSSGNTDLG